MLGRETPVYILQHLVLSFGGHFYHQDECLDNEALMKTVTHVCMDRPLPAGQMDKNKEYVQPQYIADCINNLFLLPTKPYAPGQPAPAHLSPFVDNEELGYVPDRQREIDTLAGKETTTMVVDAGDDSSSEEVENKEESDDDEAKGDADSSSDEDSDDESSEEEEPQKPVTKKAAAAKAR